MVLNLVSSIICLASISAFAQSELIVPNLTEGEYEVVAEKSSDLCIPSDVAFDHKEKVLQLGSRIWISVAEKKAEVKALGPGACDATISTEIKKSGKETLIQQVTEHHCTKRKEPVKTVTVQITKGRIVFTQKDEESLTCEWKLVKANSEK